MKKTIFIVSILAAFVISSCGKYEEGPKFSLRSKKARLAGEWKEEKVTVDGKEQPLEGDVTYVFEKDGKGRIVATWQGIPFTLNFEWEFVGDVNIRKRTQNWMGQWSEWEEHEILRLTNKEFWYKTVEKDSAGKEEVTITYLKAK